MPRVAAFAIVCLQRNHRVAQGSQAAIVHAVRCTQYSTACRGSPLRVRTFSCSSRVCTLPSVCMRSGGSKLFFDEEPPSAMLKNFKQRGDNQIMSLELLSIAYGVLHRLTCVPDLCGIRSFELCQESLHSQTTYEEEMLSFLATTRPLRLRREMV